MAEDQHLPDHGHRHTHGVVDPSLLTTERGIWAIKWSFVGLFATAVFQGVIVLLTGSVALIGANELKMQPIQWFAR